MTERVRKIALNRLDGIFVQKCKYTTNNDLHTRRFNNFNAHLLLEIDRWR